VNTKKIVISFGALTLVLALVFSSCTPDKPETTTGGSNTTATTKPAPEGLEHLTDASGQNVTMKTTDENGKEIINNVYVPIGQNTTAPANAPSGQTQTTITGQQSDPNTASQAIQTIANAFNANRFHMVCAMTDAEGKTTEIDIMLYDQNMRVEMDFDENTRLSVGIYDNEFYLINTQKQTYTTISKTLMKAQGMNLDDLNISSATDAFKSIFSTSSEPQISTVSLDGQAVTRYTYKGASGETMYVYLKGNNPVKFESVDASGKAGLNMQISKFNANIQLSDVNPISGYKKQNMISFFTDMGMTS
jgi:hypothetical protein